MAALMWIIVFLLLISLTYWFFTHRLAAWSSPRNEGEEAPSLRTLFPWLTHRRLFFVAGGLAFFLLVYSSVIVIRAGSRGIVFDIFRGVLPEPLTEGLHFILPVVQQVTRYDVRTHTYTMSQRPGDAMRGDNETLWAPTADGLKVGLEITVRYKPDPARLSELYRSIGPEPDYEDKIIRPAIRNVSRMVVSEYNILDVYSKRRATIQQQIFDRLKGMFARDGLVCEEVLLRDVLFSKEFEAALESKMMAGQKVQQLEFEVQQAQKRAEARVKEAQGESEAFDVINASIEKNPRLLEYMWIHRLAKDVKLLVVPKDGNSGIMINPDTLLKDGGR
jgi:regulator of protease activity HflC (stomatin/prohibitin superfamily)